MADFTSEAFIQFLASNIAPAAVVLIAGIIIIKLVLKGLKKGLESNKHIDGMLVKFITNAVRIALYIILALQVLKMAGVDSTSLLTVFAAAGAAIALGLQGSLSNLASGILIIFNKPFKRGDYIASAGVEGTVESIDLLYTTIVTADNKIVNLPNSNLTSGSITNYTKSGSRRTDVLIGVSYDSDIEKAKAILVDIAKKSNCYIATKELTADIVEYGDSAVILRIRGWVKPDDYWTALGYVNNNIKPEFDKAGIEIPFTQIDIHTK